MARNSALSLVADVIVVLDVAAAAAAGAAVVKAADCD